jgi:hypothetical protein
MLNAAARIDITQVPLSRHGARAQRSAGRAANRHPLSLKARWKTRQLLKSWRKLAAMRAVLLLDLPR